MSKFIQAVTQSARQRVYGRRLGRAMTESRQNVLTTLYPSLQMPADRLTEDGTLDPKSLFTNPSGKTVFEIGFGNGEHLKAMMEQQPGCNYIGAEPFINGMSAFLKSIEAQEHGHVRVWMDDALMLVRSFPAESLDTIYILNPDPWPKKRHHKRRIVNQDNLKEYHRTLKPGGQLIMTTDVDDLAEWMVTETMRHGGFTWQAERAKDWQTMPEGWFRTRYEMKGEVAGRKQTYLLFEKSAL